MENNNTPILFIIYRRLSTTQRVFQAIREAKPACLFIAANGPSADNDKEAKKCEEVRKYVLDNIDWDCEVKTLFREENLCCGKSISSAITWFFNQVEEGIILEDDCVPHPDFFEYCKELLDKYRDNENIAIISGDNFQDGKKQERDSYYFTKHNYMWGWATWRRVWKDYQYDLNLLDKDIMWKRLDDTFKSKPERRYWKSLFEKVANWEIDTWDYQLSFHIWYNQMFSIAPNVNLIQNIGFGEEAVHTSDPNSKAAFLKTESILPIIHPKKIKINNKFDNYVFNHYYCSQPPVSLFKRVIRKFFKKKSC
jgi:hypothetical protein